MPIYGFTVVSQVTFQISSHLEIANMAAEEGETLESLLSKRRFLSLILVFSNLVNRRICYVKCVKLRQADVMLFRFLWTKYDVFRCIGSGLLQRGLATEMLTE